MIPRVVHAYRRNAIIGSNDSDPTVAKLTLDWGTEPRYNLDTLAYHESAEDTLVAVTCQRRDSNKRSRERVKFGVTRYHVCYHTCNRN